MPVREKNIMDENNIYKEFSKLRKNEAGNYNDNSYGNKENIYIYIYIEVMVKDSEIKM